VSSRTQTTEVCLGWKYVRQAVGWVSYSLFIIFVAAYPSLSFLTPYFVSLPLTTPVPCCETIPFYSIIQAVGSRVVSVLDSGAEGLGFKSQSLRCRVTVLGKLFTPIVPLFTE